MTTPDSNNSAPAEGTSTSPDETSETSAYNPAWGDWFQELPQEFQVRTAPHLREADKRYQELSTKYSWAKDYEPDQVQQYKTLYDTANSDPVGFYTRYKQALEEAGMLPKEAAAAAKEAAQEQDQPQTSNEDDDPRYKALMDKIAELEQPVKQQQQWLQEQANQQQIATYQSQIESDIQALRAQHGVFDESQVLDRLQANLALGKPGGVKEAYQEMVDYDNKVLARVRPGHSAPNVTNPNNAGGIPPTALMDKPKNAEERAAYLKARLEAATS